MSVSEEDDQKTFTMMKFTVTKGLTKKSCKQVLSISTPNLNPNFTKWLSVSWVRSWIGLKFGQNTAKDHQGKSISTLNQLIIVDTYHTG